MQMIPRVALLLCLWSTVAPGQETPPAAPASTALAPGTFEQRVIGYGGHVDYLFTDGRPFKEYFSGGSSGRGLVRGLTGSNKDAGSIDCGMSSLCETKAGNLLCAYFAGADATSGDAGIWLSRYSQMDGWSAPERIARVGPQPHSNPILFRDPRRAIYVFFKVGAPAPNWQSYWCKSEDGGRSFSDPVELVAGDKGGRGPVKNKPVILSDGAWLAPGSTDRGDREQGAWKAFADRSEDGGTTWTKGPEFAVDPNVVPGAGTIQPAFWESAPNQVHALMRTSGGFIGRCDSPDGGKTWSPVVSSGLANNNSPIDVLRIEDGRLVLAYNPAGQAGGSKTPLNLALSADNGATWKDLASLENGPGDYVWPSLVRTQRGIAVSYTWKEERVRCWQIPLKALN